MTRYDDLREQVRTVVQDCELTNIEYYEVSARSVVAKSTPEPKVEGDKAYHFEAGLQTQQFHENEKFAIRLITQTHVPNGVATVDVGAVYELNPARELSEELLVEFANLVGVMALVPYIRERTHELTAYLKQPVVLPIIRAGELNFSLSEEET